MGGLDVAATVGTLALRNPLLLASGFLDETAESMLRVWNAGAGGMVTKSIGLAPRPGHANPSLVEVSGGYVNAMGLPNPGIEDFAADVAKVRGEGGTVIGSVFGGTAQEFATLAGRMEAAGAQAVELNVSCPHAKGYGTDIGCDVKLLAPVVAAARDAIKIPLWVKLAPNVPNIVEQARASVEAGADALVCVNTLKAIAIDAQTRRPVLGNRVGGLSGPALKPVALRAVWDIHEALPEVPLVGVGGIESGRDVVEFVMAGASAVQLGSVLVRDDVAAFARIAGELKEWMKENAVPNLSTIQGAAVA